MFIVKTDDPHLSKMLPGPIWAEALEWIDRYARGADLGFHHIRDDHMFVNVQAYESKPREQCHFESHRRFVDLQYVMEGIEGIDYRPAGELTPNGDFDEEKDFQLYHPADPLCLLPVCGNAFCVFFPGDAHRPKVAVGDPAPLRKLVVKIDLELLQ